MGPIATALDPISAGDIPSAGSEVTTGQALEEQFELFELRIGKRAGHLLK